MHQLSIKDDTRDGSHELDRLMLLESVIDLIEEGVVVIDERGIIILCNNAYCRRLSQGSGEIVGRQIKEIAPQSGLIAFRQGKKLEKVIRNQTNGVSTIHFLKKLQTSGGKIGAAEFIIQYDPAMTNGMISQVKKLESEVDYYRDTIIRLQEYDYSLEQIVGRSSKILELKKTIQMVGKTSSNILIQGESGTGKELFARAIHGASPRCCQPLIKINCAAIPEPLLESELFGYEDGAFTGAKRGGKIGRFELAHRGTLFLDEIGDMSMSMQAKLLRVLQEREFERVGGTKSISVDIRLVSATNKDLWSEVGRGNFREDLYFRLNVVNIQIPPLRERKEDIPLLSKFILAKLARKMGYYPMDIADKVIQLFGQYSWPGNIREMENVLESALNMLDGDHEVKANHIPFRLQHLAANSSFKDARSLNMVVEEAEQTAMAVALKQAGGDFNKAADLLSISRSSFYLKAKKYSIKANRRGDVYVQE
ncbi:MAG: sigma-54-dependent Fis family transcriptional regulator [Firmicutes bacterium HGW-Firmicutes-15]|nr:MAG: sigma-54-dependent Fis family transcriptional regulator [Firmicutes bacterium HGW-Firmicutes-15]